MPSLLPTQDKRPRAYFDWLMREVNKDEAREWIRPEWKPIKVKGQMKKSAGIMNFFKTEIIKIILI